MGKRRSFSPGFKAPVVPEVLGGAETPAEVCREHRLSPQSLANWTRQFLEDVYMHKRIHASPGDT